MIEDPAPLVDAVNVALPLDLSNVVCFYCRTAHTADDDCPMDLMLEADPCTP